VFINWLGDIVTVDLGEIGKNSCFIYTFLSNDL
jgi:hypothetical protein